MKGLSKIQKHTPTVNDPRPDWMKEFHSSVKGGSDQFKKWAKESAEINIDKQLAYDEFTGDNKNAALIVEAITNNQPFMLYADHKRACVIIPKINSIITIFPGSNSQSEILTPRQFQNRVKMLYVTYPNFDYPPFGVLKSAFKMLLMNCTPQTSS